MTKASIKSYSELITFEDFYDRFNYLKLPGIVGEPTFDLMRYLNQEFYHSKTWRGLKDQIIARDMGCDLGCEERPIRDRVVLHHINPITVEDVLNMAPNVIDPENLICCSSRTHRAIHFGDIEQVRVEPIVRTPNDTCPWRMNK